MISKWKKVQKEKPTKAGEKKKAKAPQGSPQDKPRKFDPWGGIENGWPSDVVPKRRGRGSWITKW